MGPSISEKQLKKVMSYVEIGKQEGATIACGGNRLTEAPMPTASSTSRPFSPT